MREILRENRDFGVVNAPRRSGMQAAMSGNHQRKCAASRSFAMVQARRHTVSVFTSAHPAIVTDEQIVASLLAGETAAWPAFHARFNALIQRCVAKVLRRFSSMLAGDDLEEVTGIFYLSLLSNDLRKLRSFDPTQSTKAASWIAMLATHAAYDHLRRRRRDAGCAELGSAAEVACTAPSAFDVACRHQRAERTVATLQQFSARDREFAELYFGEGQNPEVIAERLQISIKTVYSKKHKIQSKLEILLAQDVALAA
jgi:RNA polymerase sigma-70 factor, ECF subfamily